AFKSKGVQPLLDAGIESLASPHTIPPIVGTEVATGGRVERPTSDEEPFAALAFQVMSDRHVGKLTYFRVYSGRLPAGGQVLNATKDRKERIGRILQMHANHREDKNGVFAG